jgi:hypothetical protein
MLRPVADNEIHVHILYSQIKFLILHSFVFADVSSIACIV